MFQKGSKYLENFLGIKSDSSTNFTRWPTGRSRYCLGCCQRQPPIPCQQPRTFGRISWRCHHLRCYPICQPNCLSSRYWNRCHQDPSKYSLSVLVACLLKIFGNIWDEMTMNFYCILVPRSRWARSSFIRICSCRTSSCCRPWCCRKCSRKLCLHQPRRYYNFFLPESYLFFTVSISRPTNNLFLYT